MDKKYPIPLLVLGVWEDGDAERLVPVTIEQCYAHMRILTSLSSQLMPVHGSECVPETWVLSCKHEAL